MNSRSSYRVIRGTLGVLVVLALTITVRGWWNEYRTAVSSSRDVDGRPTPSAEPTPSPEPPAEEEDDEASGSDETESESTAVPKPSKAVVILIDGLNFRTAPKGDARPIRGLAKGEKLTLLSERAGWYEVRSTDDAEGWVSSNPNYTRVEDL